MLTITFKDGESETTHDYVSCTEKGVTIGNGFTQRFFDWSAVVKIEYKKEES